MTEITVINPKELRVLISEIMKEQLEKVTDLIGSRNVLDERPLTPKEAREYLSMSRSTFSRYVKKGLIPEGQLGDKPYYKKSQIDDAIKKVN